MRGFTLMEVVVSVLLIATCVLLIIGLLPMSLLSFKKAQRVQDATLYGTAVLEELERDPYLPDHVGQPATFATVQVHGSEYQVATAVQTPFAPDAAGQSYLVEVTVAWDGQPVPVHFATMVRP